MNIHTPGTAVIISHRNKWEPGESSVSLLESLGWTCVFVHNRSEVLATVQKEQPELIIVSDIIAASADASCSNDIMGTSHPVRGDYSKFLQTLRGACKTAKIVLHTSSTLTGGTGSRGYSDEDATYHPELIEDWWYEGRLSSSKLHAMFISLEN